MLVFAHLRGLAEFRKRHLPFLQSIEDQELLREIGHYQVLGAPITLTQLLMLGIGSAATVQRRLQRLKRLGVVQENHSRDDRRVIELTLSPGCMKSFGKFDMLLAGERKPRLAGARAAEERPRHVCALCDGDASGRDMAVRFLREGLLQGQACIVVGPRLFRHAVMARLERAPGNRAQAADLVDFEGARSSASMFEFFGPVLERARSAGKSARVAGNMAWAHGKMDFDTLMDFEARLDAQLRKFNSGALCQYDVRHFSSPQLLRALKCHPDTGRYPVMLG